MKSNIPDKPTRIPYPLPRAVKWVVASAYDFPDLEENSVHYVIDTDGNQIRAEYCCSADEYWWLDISTRKEVAILCYFDCDLTGFIEPPSRPPKRIICEDPNSEDFKSWVMFSSLIVVCLIAFFVFT